ncbi:glycerophosphodiester phosphodiesterase family protein [Rosistilla oblonga]|uniref:Glycerophosphoryl diester phosphodiesterase n=1 Tax=Rosistilla oblonga TaxID=2527990 RepID=A0A518INK5_9BACT|nr:glycerophosphodiester phosphodiesterase family protein [Rosistilla oblonga]QDV54667.1 Glycerophosphoryl diester phosphodiesterase [Rosistilla oblonga]
MFQTVCRNLYSCFRTLLAVDLIFKLAAFTLLTPAVSLLFRLFLSLSGRSVLADADIARFLLHPTGWLAVVIVGGGVLAVLAIEQAVLMTVCLGADQSLKIRPSRVAIFVAERTRQVLWLTTRVVARVALTALPFLAVGGGLFLFLLTDHDINFYLTAKPPKFWLAVGLIGTVLVAMAVALLYRVSAWAFALPLLLYRGLSPTEALAESKRLASPHRWRIVGSLAVWAISNLAFGFCLSFLTTSLGELVLPSATRTIWTLIAAVGMLLVVLTIANFIASLIANASCASLLGMLYLRHVDEPGQRLVEMPTWGQWNGIRLTGGRIVSAVVIGGLVAAVLGVLTLESISIEDRVQITAHRGGATHSPENTMAAFRRAIDDGADWVEIDVQESSDGVVVVAHDSDLKKVAGNPVKIWNATAEELRSIDIGGYFSADYTSERMPTLEEVLALCKDTVGVNIELKYYGHTDRLEQRVVDLVERFEMEDQIVIMSLDAKGIAKLKKLRPDWICGLLTAVAVSDLTRAKVDFLAVNTSLATQSFINAAHRVGKTVSVWTVNDAKTMSAMISRGVDNLITDDPALAGQVLAERATLNPVERLMLELAFQLGLPMPAGAPQ